VGWVGLRLFLHHLPLPDYSFGIAQLIKINALCKSPGVYACCVCKCLLQNLLAEKVVKRKRCGLLVGKDEGKLGGVESVQIVLLLQVNNY
jgi:hypothetical protein